MSEEKPKCITKRAVEAAEELLKQRDDLQAQLNWSLGNEEKYKKELAASMDRENQLRAELSRQEQLALDEFSRWGTIQKERDQLRAEIEQLKRRVEASDNNYKVWKQERDNAIAASEKLADALEYYHANSGDSGDKALAEYREKFPKQDE
jgi:tRNA/tmRNA/rRNA uracil-C5-methylase (TrmA/RlmC/RlmD family)